ncbi:MAG: glycosyltransferase [Ignavibacteriales bacterium]|nr:glycosyltransferase [Ignavibacteriales bacterium]
MTIAAIILSIVSFFFFLLSIITVRKVFTRSNRKNLSELPAFSIIIACKNAGKTLPALLPSLRQLRYPNAMFEIIFVDDCSEDDTKIQLLEFVKHSGIPSEYLLVTNKLWPAKKGVLAAGIAKARFDYLVITDADCVISADWLNGFAEKYAEGYEMIVGPAPFYSNNQLINKIACFEQFHNSLLMLSMAEHGHAFTATARNLTFTRNLYEACGGYTKTLGRLSGDDDLLLQEAKKAGFSIGYITSLKYAVFSYTPENFKKYLRQKARHVSTSHIYPTKTKLLLTIWFALQSFSLFSFLLTPFSVLFIVPTAIKLTYEIWVVKAHAEEAGYRFTILQCFLLPFLKEIFVPVHFIRSIFWNKNW